MFAGWKVAGAIALVGLLTTGGSVMLWKMAAARATVAESKLGLAAQKNLEMEAQSIMLQGALTQALEAGRNAADSLVKANELIAQQKLNYEWIIQDYEDEKEKFASLESLPASPLLVYATNSLRAIATEVGTMRAGYLRKRGGAQSHDPGRTTDTANIATPLTDRDFAVTALRFATAYKACSKMLIDVDVWQDGENLIYFPVDGPTS